MPVVSAMIAGWDNSKHCYEFTWEFVCVFVGWLALDIGDLEFLEAILSVLFNAHGCNKFVTNSCRNELITTSRQWQKEQCNDQAVIYSSDNLVFATMMFVIIMLENRATPSHDCKCPCGFIMCMSCVLCQILSDVC